MQSIEEKIAGLSAEKQKLLQARLLERKTAPAKAAMPPARRLPAEFAVQVSDFVTIQHRPLLDLIVLGELEQVDAVSLTCAADQRASDGTSMVDVFRKTRGELPAVFKVRETEYGRIATILLPYTYAQIYERSESLARMVRQAALMSKAIGAKVVSLTGLIPSATGYGRHVTVRPGMPALTTGHATTICAVTLSIKALLEAAWRDIRNENVAFVGLGSVGRSTLKLMLSALPHPRQITLCDVVSRHGELKNFAEDLRQNFLFGGSISIVPSRHVVGDDLYGATVIVGATNVPNVIEVEKLRPGTLVIDDSDPHCFDAPRAIARMEAEGDVLLSEGGFLKLPNPIREHIYVPLEYRELAGHFSRTLHSPHNLTGCNFSGLLSTRFGLPTTVGEVDMEHGRIHLAHLSRLKVSAADAHCADYLIPSHVVDGFRAKFGGRNSLLHPFASWVSSLTQVIPTQLDS